MRGRTTSLGALLIGAALVGCASSSESSPRDIDGVFPARGMTLELPFRLSDRLGLVETVTIAERRVADGVTQVTGRDDAIYLQWTGGMCDRQVLIVFDRAGDGLALGISTGRDFGGCRMAGINRTLELDLRDPIDASAVSVAEIE